MRHLISLADISSADLLGIVERACGLAAADHCPESLKGNVIGTYFRHTSTRTRTAFSVGAQRLGARLVSFGPHDLQENTGETFQDTGRVLATMLDCHVVRASVRSRELREICGQRRMGVINAMTEDEHPTQAITDLAALLERRRHLDGLSLLYIGEGNSTAAALALAMAVLPGARLHLRTPAGFGVPAETMKPAMARAKENGSLLEEKHTPDDLPAEDIDAVYTTRWQTTATVKHDPDWRRHFQGFSVTTELMARYPLASFMHDLPAHRGEEVEAAVLDGARSIAFQQAAFKMYGAMAVLEWCLREEGCATSTSP